jgi:hypothetical protein
LGAIVDFGFDLGVEKTLERWSLADPEKSSVVNRQSSIHLTVWEQMNAWLDNVALAFLREQGFKYLKSVKGGIGAWSDEIDHSVPKY